MMTFFCIVLAFVAAGLLTEMIATANAPLGYQDDTGFHFGPPNAPQQAAYEVGNPS